MKERTNTHIYNVKTARDFGCNGYQRLAKAKSPYYRAFTPVLSFTLQNNLLTDSPSNQLDALLSTGPYH